MESNFTNYANNQIIHKYSSQSIQAINTNINVVINNPNLTKNSNININNNILVIQNFNKGTNNNNDDIKKESTPQSNESPRKRIDRKGNEIKQAGKHCVVFIDKISKTRFADIVEIESYKTFNQNEFIPSSNSQKNSCCTII